MAPIHLPLGLLVAAFHDVWSWPGVVVTVLGWALVAKGTIYLIAPRLAQRTLKIPGEGAAAERSYRLAGIAMLPVALFLGGWRCVEGDRRGVNPRRRSCRGKPRRP